MTKKLVVAFVVCLGLAAVYGLIRPRQVGEVREGIDSKTLNTMYELAKSTQEGGWR